MTAIFLQFVDIISKQLLYLCDVCELLIEWTVS